MYHVTVDRTGTLDSLTDPKAGRAWAYSQCVCSHEDSTLAQLRLTAFQENTVRSSYERQQDTLDRPQHSRSSQCSPLPHAGTSLGM